MAKKNIREDTPEKTLKPTEQISDIILILDKMELLISAVTKLDRDGNCQSVPADQAHQNSFLKIDKFSSIAENFFRNFWNQLRDPSRFGLFSMKSNEFDTPENRQAMKDLTDGKQTKAVEEFLMKYDITPKSKENQSINNQKTETMAKQNQQASTPIAAQSTAPGYRFNESMINWEQLKNFGISREFLQEKGLLDQMLKGYKSNQTIPLSMNFGSAVLRTDARLSFQQSVGGPVVLGIHGIRQQPDLDRPFFGHNFSEDDKQNLRETGNMGRVVELKMRNGEYAPSFISIDKITNEIVAMKAENVFIPNEIKNVKLTEREKQDLKEGKSVYLEGMKAKSGNDFNAHVQINADRRGIEFRFDNEKLFNSQIIGGVTLTAKQVENLNAGKAIFVEDMKRKDGENFSAFVKLDEASGRPAYTRYNPDSAEGAREIYVPKEMNGTALTPDDRQQLREGKAVFLENMVNRKGEEFSSFVKLDLETGIPSYSKTPDGFEARQKFEIPAELWGITLSATQRANLQDGKAVLVQDMKGFDGNKFSSYVKVNASQGRLDYYNENPDRKKDAAQRNVVSNAQKQDKQDNLDNKKTRSRGVSH